MNSVILLNFIMMHSEPLCAWVKCMCARVYLNVNRYAQRRSGRTDEHWLSTVHPYWWKEFEYGGFENRENMKFYSYRLYGVNFFNEMYL
jgi:hypothetical protein